MSECQIGVMKFYEKASEELQATFGGKVLWSVKLSLEARGIIKRIPKTSPQNIQLKK